MNLQQLLDLTQPHFPRLCSKIACVDRFHADAFCHTNIITPSKTYYYAFGCSCCNIKPVVKFCTPTKRVVNIGGAHVLAVALHHAVEVVPNEGGGLPVVNALDHIATCVIFVVRADVVFEEVVEDFVGALLCRGVVFCGLMRLVRMFIRRARCHRGDVARRVKRKQFYVSVG